ncbi:MAG TPA: trypsin-like peptidase domain-containing protein [Gammaproteobacteria bacterium]|nr:trypsin-like peptidase domain-containing protein [Gammaproteobacteria bacterium]
MKSRILALAALLFVSTFVYAGLAATPVADQPAFAQSGGRLAYEQNTIDIVNKYGASVVAINVTVKGKRVNPMQNVPPQFRQFFKQFMPPGFNSQQGFQPVERAAGSGFVVDNQDEIITNYHVVGDALENDKAKLAHNAKVTVRFPGEKKELPVKVVGVDQSYDLALLRVAPKDKDKIPKDVQPIPLADSNKVRVGEKAIAIGNPFGLQSTVTQGIVSALNRRQEAMVSGVPISYIQTDAAINPGNSGGPLLNSKGQVIGINDEILAPHGTFIGVGFAIPSNLIRQHLSELQKGGFIKKAQIGVSVISLNDYPDSVRQTLNLPDHGVMIVQVAPGGPADKADLKGAQFTVTVNGQQWPAGGDIILKVNGKNVKDASTLQSYVFSHKAGDHVKLEIEHKGHKRNVTVTLAVLNKKQDRQLMQQHP